jgi:hypothetical protein
VWWPGFYTDGDEVSLGLIVMRMPDAKGIQPQRVQSAH